MKSRNLTASARPAVIRAAGFGIAAAAVAMSPGTALAAGAESAESASAAVAAGAAEQPRPEVRLPDRKPDPVAADSTVPPQAASASVADDAGEALYGPPSPKARKGKLPEIAWPEPPAQVPPALEEAVRIVTHTYPSAKAARSALRAAASDVRAAQWLRFPSLSANVASYTENGNSLIPQVTVDLPLWTAGRISSGIRRARADEDVSSARYVSTAQALALTTAQTYFQIASFTLREQLLADSLKEHARLVQTMERRVTQEVSPLADLELARSRAAQIEQQYTVTRAQRQTALRVMAELVADPDYDLGPVPFFDRGMDLPNRDALEDQAVAYDPEIKRLLAEADVARAERDSVRASIFPQLNAQYSYDEFNHSRVGLALRAQTLGGLAQFSQVEASRLRIDAALEQARVAEQQLRREVASDIIEYDSSRVRSSISLGASETAAKVSASYMRQFIAGRRSWLDVMNALREAVNAQIDRADSEVSAMASAVRLLIVSGRWRPEFPQKPVYEQN